MTPKRVWLAVSVALVAALTACNVEPVPPSTKDVPSMTAMEPPPTVPPAVSIQDSHVAVNYFEWIVDDKEVTFKASLREEDASLSSFPLPASDSITIDVMSPVKPADFVVVIFDKVDEQGQPIQSSALEVDCIREAEQCTLNLKAEKVTAMVSLGDTRPEIIVVHLIYLAEGLDGELHHLVGAWGARVES